MYALRQWSIRNAQVLEWLYENFEGVMVALHPLWLWMGYNRIEGPIRGLERRIKATLFDCRMCGRCVLSQTGMSCPMNCPKELRNGPCGGVRQNGNCEVSAEMKCVWLEAWAGTGRMRRGGRLTKLIRPVDHRLEGSSAWLRRLAERSAEGSAPR